MQEHFLYLQPLRINFVIWSFDIFILPWVLAPCKASLENAEKAAILNTEMVNFSSLPSDTLIELCGKINQIRHRIHYIH